VQKCTLWKTHTYKLIKHESTTKPFDLVYSLVPHTASLVKQFFIASNLRTAAYFS